MKLPAYPKYKRSAIDWLPSVPVEWNVKRSDGVVSADRVQVAPEVFVGREVFHYSIPVVQEKGTGQIENGDRLASAKQVVNKPVVLVSKLNPRKATICIAAPQPGFLTLCSTEFVALNADRCELRFLDYLVRSELFRQLLDSKVQSVTRSHQRAKPDDIYKFWNAWPSRGEQRAIADFLECETARLDMLVGKKRELIEKLKEKRTALISRTVIRGLNPNVKLKPSGIEWLGDIPENWQIKFLRRIAKINYGIGGEIDRSLVEGVKTISLPNIDIEGRLNVDDVPYADVSEAEKRDVLLRKGDLLFNWRNGSSDHLGKTAYFNEDGEFSHVSFLLRLRFESHKNESKFFQHLLGGYRTTRFFSHSKAGVNNTFNLSELSALPVICPPITEQRAIAEYLDRETAKLDRMMEKVEAAIEKLQEYRTALITAAVTRQDRRAKWPKIGCLDLRRSPN